jgi:hypothetical protein
VEYAFFVGFPAGAFLVALSIEEELVCIMRGRE